MSFCHSASRSLLSRRIAFLVDTYQGKVKEYNFVHYMLFVTYFPHLIAGPI